MEKVRLKQKEDRRLARGHLWAFRNEFEPLPPLADGQIVEVLSDTKKLVGRGFYQSDGGIAVRLLTRHADAIDGPFLRRRIERARLFRERLFPASNVYRWIYGESDELPGLIADRFGSVVTVHSPCAFYGHVRAELANAFMEDTSVHSVRIAVGKDIQWFGEAVNPVSVTINDLQFSINVESGQKTGFYLDQRENCVDIAAYSGGARVLDGHCYNGLWSCHAAIGGASKVLAVDSSRPAIETAMMNAVANGLEGIIKFECEDIQTVLRRGEQYDVVVLDPPALAKSRAHVEKSLGVYQALNREAMKSLVSGGILVTSSCSHFVDMAAFMEMIKRAARAARREVWVLSRKGASRDHPVLLSMPETDYLTCVTLRVF
ncbi:MAG: SAM-dependent methyltransferase [Candidatus Hydrogenedentota bacterium]